MDGLEIGDIVQITDPDNKWFPCLLIVSEVKLWGVQGYLSIPNNDGSLPGNAYYRIETGKFEKVGSANVVVE